MTWNTSLYNYANDCVAQSWEKWDLDQKGKSWGYVISARLAYVCDAIVNVVLLPFAIIGIIFGTVHALCTRNYQSELFQITKNNITERTNHLFLSIFGALISPAIAHRYRDANLAPYFIAFRITFLTGGLIYYAFSH